MIKYFFIIAVAVGAVAWIYNFGYNRAQLEYELKIELLKRESAENVIKQQNEVKKEYEQKIQNLKNDLNNANALHDQRMHQLKLYKSRSTDLETCTRERNELARIGAGFENVADRSVKYLKSMIDNQEKKQ